MRMVRRVRWRALAASLAMLALAGVTAGCGGGGGGSDETKIALLLPSDSAARYQGGAGFQRKAKDLCAGCSVLFSNAKGSAARQQSQADRALAEGADVLVIDPVDPHAASRIVRKAGSMDVPVISYARPIPNSPVDYHVGVDEEGLGTLQGYLLLTKLKEEGDPKGPIVVVTIGSDGPQNVGFRKTIDSGGVKVAREYSIDESAPEGAAFALARREMRQAITALGANGFAAVFTPDDETAAGAIAAMKAAGIDPRARPTIGSGASLPAVRRVLAGQQYTSAYEASGQVGFAGAKMAVRLARGGEVPASWITDELANGGRKVPAVLLQPTAVTSENLNSTVIPYGFTKPAQLCAGSYAKYCHEAGIPTG
jgi:D-xylose transport system substrate-binding protein